MSYCTESDIEAYLGLPPGHGISISRYISLAEAEIEALSYTCYAGKQCISDLESHTITSPMGMYWWGAGIPIHLRHRPIRRVIQFEIFMGGTWRNLLNDPEGRGSGSWWCDYQYGVCFIRYIFWAWGGREIRIKYEYGYSELPPYVKEACILIASKNILMTERNRLAMYESTQTLDFNTMIEHINEQLQILLNRIVGIGIPTGLTT